LKVAGLFFISAVKKSAYLMNTARDFRLKLKSASSAGAKKGQAPAVATKPTHGTIYVAKTYPPWQCTVISVLKEMYEAGNGGDNKAISQVTFEFNFFLNLMVLSSSLLL
jgi:leucyl-tRNA synthetase